MLFDSHAHAFPDAIAASAMKSLIAGARHYQAKAYADGTVAGLLASMDRAGVDCAILCSIATKPTQVHKITDWSAAIASERIIPFASIHPDYPEPESECQRIASLGIRGLKFHPQYMNCAVDDPRTYRIARAAAAYNLALTFHAGYDLAFDRDELASPLAIRKLHDAIPNLRLQACHLGGWERWEESLELIVGQPIYLETSFCLGQCPPALLEKILTRHPQTHLMWGTDSPWEDHAADLARFRALRLTDAQRQAMLWDNARTFVGLEA